MKRNCPENVTAVLRRLSGQNLFGEPKVRVVWGGSRLGWVVGTKESPIEERDRYGALIREVIGERYLPLYPQQDRWHFEVWKTAESYGSPERWPRDNGPFPSTGDYEHSMTLEGPRGEYVEITPTIAQAFVERLQASQQLTPAQMKAHLHAKAAQQERDYENYAEAVLSDTAAFYGRPFVTVQENT